MTLRKIFELGLIDDSTNIYVRDSSFNTVAFDSYKCLSSFYDMELESFTWQDNNWIYLDLSC